MATSSPSPPVTTLVLDAGPLLSHQPLRTLAKHFITPPLVLQELRDPTARGRWERMKLEGLDVQVREPDAAWMGEVVAFSKKTGDYAVLSKADLCVLALAWGLHHQQKEQQAKEKAESSQGSDGTREETSQAPPAAAAPQQFDAAPSISPWTRGVAAAAQGGSDTAKESPSAAEGNDFPALEPPSAPKSASVNTTSKDELSSKMSSLEIEKKGEDVEPTTTSTAHEPEEQSSGEPAYELVEDDEDDEEEEEEEQPFSDDGEGDWITPGNVAQHKAQDLGLVPDAADDGFTTVGKGGGKRQRKNKNRAAAAAAQAAAAAPRHIEVACMTGDYAVQNVLLQMGLELVGQGGQRINQVKSWILRCHACFKLCRDSSKKFCPSCGNPALIRASITTKRGPSGEAITQVHLKKNFQYRTRGTKYSIPEPKMGSAKGQKHGGTGLILREDQQEFQNGVRREEIRRQKEDRALEKVMKAQQEGKGGFGGAVGGGWNDPDWMPELLVTGMSGKGRHSLNSDGLPSIGHGRRNPNAVRKAKK